MTRVIDVNGVAEAEKIALSWCIEEAEEIMKHNLSRDGYVENTIIYTDHQASLKQSTEGSITLMWIKGHKKSSEKDDDDATHLPSVDRSFQMVDRTVRKMLRGLRKSNLPPVN